MPMSSAKLLLTLMPRPTPLTKVSLKNLLSFHRFLTLLSVNVAKGRMWNDFDKDQSEFRNYKNACDRVKAFYEEQHGLSLFRLIHQGFLIPELEKQTVAFNIQARRNFESRKRACIGVWEAIELLNTLVDDSDPDVNPNIFVSWILFLDVTFPDQYVSNWASPTDCWGYPKGRKSRMDAGTPHSKFPTKF